MLTKFELLVFSKRFFTGWVVVVFLWAFFAAIAITCTPIVESWESLIDFFRFNLGLKKSVLLGVPDQLDRVTTGNAGVANADGAFGSENKTDQK